MSGTISLLPLYAFVPCIWTTVLSVTCHGTKTQKLAVAPNTVMCCLSAGVPELDIPSFDPIFVPVILLDYRQGNSEGKMIVRKSNVYGLKNGEILNFRLDIHVS